MEVGCVRMGGIKVECVNVGVWSNYNCCSCANHVDSVSNIGQSH